MCRSVQGLLLGCLAFSIIYIIAGGVQVSVGIVFMLVLPIFRLASNIWTGAVNIALGGAFSALICCGKSNLTKHKICLSLSIGVVVINLGNILVLEICEWRAFLPAIRIQDIVREEKTDMLLVAYLSSTISTAVALVVGFVACEYIYCLLIAGNINTEDDKPASLKRNFPCRTRRASSYEPISFSWVFEASDNFHAVHNSLMRSRGGSNKAYNPVVDLPEKPKPNVTYTKHANNAETDFSLPPKRSNVINSISTSGYSSPNWQMQQNNVVDRRHRHHYENIEFFHLSHGMHLSHSNVTNNRLRIDNVARSERDSKSLVQLPMYICGSDDVRRGVSASSSPVHQSTLPLRGHRKRSLSDSRGRRWDGKSPRKRHKTDFVAELGETSFDDLSFQHRPRLSSTPETGRRFRLPDVADVSSVRKSPNDGLQEMPSKAQNDVTDGTDVSPIDVKPTTSNAVSGCRPDKMQKSEIPVREIEEEEEDDNEVVESGENDQVVTKEANLKNKEKEKFRKQFEDSILNKGSLGYQTSISTNGLPAINIEIHQEPNESQSTWKLFRKPSWKDLEKSRYKSDDGIVFRSIDRRLKDKILETGSGGNIEAGKEGRDCIIHWKPKDGPRLSPSFLDDSDSLVNLSDLELMARQWRTNNMYKKIQQQIAFQQKRKRYNIAPVPASTNHERFAFMEPG